MKLLGEHPLAGRFNALTPEQVIEAVEAPGRRCTGRFVILNSYENRVYQMDLEEGDAVVGKFYRPGRWSPEAIEDEHDFLFELEEAEVPVIVPLLLEDDSSLGELPEGLLYALFPRVRGRAPEELSDPELRVLGRCLAEIHEVGARAEAADRPHLSPETYGRENLAFLEASETLPVEARENYLRSAEILVERMEPLFTGVPTHRIHGDCHRGNLLRTAEGLCFLDFDDMVTGPAVQDVWMLVPSSDAEGARQRGVLLDAYREIRDFDPRWLRLVEPLRGLRYIHYATWIARRWEDPVFQRTFSYFGTLQYWQREIQDLREQIARIDAHPQD